MLSLYLLEGIALSHEMATMMTLRSVPFFLSRKKKQLDRFWHFIETSVPTATGSMCAGVSMLRVKSNELKNSQWNGYYV